MTENTTSIELSNTDKHHIIAEAADWLTLMDCAPLDKQQNTALKQWQMRSPQHQDVWQAAQNLHRTLAALPNSNQQSTTLSRRDLLRCLTYLSIVGPLSYGGYKYSPWRHLTAEHTSNFAQQRKITLADGSIVWLNTDTLISTDFTAKSRLLHLHSGEIYIETIKNTAPSPDPSVALSIAQNIIIPPFIVTTPLGTVQALGTRFSVRNDKNSTRAIVNVFADKVKISCKHQQQSLLIEQGQSASFTERNINVINQQVSQQALAQPAWLEGELSADNMPLTTFIAELSRYRVGILACQPSLAHLTVSGLFQLNDSEQILKLLKQTLPISIKFLTRYWVRISAR